MDNAYGRLIHRALHHRPTVLGLGTALTVAAVLILPTIGFELMPQADEGEVQVTAELPVGTRIERREDVALRLESLAKEYVPGADRHHRPRRAAAAGSAAAAVAVAVAAAAAPDDHPARAEGRAEALERADRARPEPAAGERHPRRDHHDPRLGRQPAGEPPARQRRHAASRSRSAATTCSTAQRIALEAKNVMDKVPEVRNARVGRDEGRPGARGPGRSAEGGAARAVGDQRRQLHPHQRRRHAGGVLPRGRQRIPDRRAAARGGSRARRGPQRRADQHAAAARCCRRRTC